MITQFDNYFPMLWCKSNAIMTFNFYFLKDSIQGFYKVENLSSSPNLSPLTPLCDDYSISAWSAGPEREFSRMGYLLSSRRSRYTPSHTNKRLTLANLIPQKRRLERLLTVRKIKKIKLFK